LTPLVERAIHHYNPRWALGGGFMLIAIGDGWIATQSAATLSMLPIVAPLALIGIGFAFALSGVTAVAVNTVPNHLAGMASGTTSQLRDFGFTLGPAVVGAIALSQAAAEIHNKLAASAALRSALAAFNAAPSHVPESQRASVEAAVGAVSSGPLGANAVPSAVPSPNGGTMPFNPLKDVAFQALDHAYSVGYLVCGAAALVSAVLVAVLLRGAADRPTVTEASLHD
jgi:hypothetical protein